MRKAYCDICGTEISDQNRWDPKGIKKVFTHKYGSLTILLSVYQVTSYFDCCKYCIIDVAKDMDDRHTST